jgi:aspyridone synthetase trans-acting enoyl reductase
MLVQTPKIQIRGGGLEALEEGIEEVRTGKVRGYKLVYTIA